jgi:outer membrane autotransporter protein
MTRWKHNAGRRLLAGVIAAGLCSTAGADPIRDQTGFQSNTLARNDDGSTASVGLGFNIVVGTAASSLFVNNNGNVTFGAPSGAFSTPPDLPLIAPFFSDVDTSQFGTPVTYGQGVINGHSAFGVNWFDVTHFGNEPTDNGTRNTFQLVVIDRSDTGTGNFDIEFNYAQLQWDQGTASATSALVGASDGSGQVILFDGSGVSGAFLDGGPQALAANTNAGVPGRFIIQCRDGVCVLVGQSVSDVQSQQTEQIASSLTRTQSQFSATTVVNRIRALLPASGRSFVAQNSQFGTGLSAGEDGAGFDIEGLSVWIDGTRSRIDNSEPLAVGTLQTRGGFSGRVNSVLAGADYVFTPNLVVGAALGYEDSLLDLLGGGDGKFRSDGTTAVVYGAYIINDYLNLIGQLGATRVWGNISQAPARGLAEVTGDPNSWRALGGVTLVAQKAIQEFLVGARIGFNYTKSFAADYNASDGSRVNVSNSHVGQLSVGADVAYNLTSSVTPYANAAYLLDTSASGDGDRNAVEYGGGVRLSVTENLSGDLGGAATINRENERLWSVNAGLRWRF